MNKTEYIQSELSQHHNWFKIGNYSVTNELFLDLIFTHRCNCNCPFCIACTKTYSNNNYLKWEKSLKQTLEIFDIKSLIILGGEATVDEFFYERIKTIEALIQNKEINNVILTTNGLMLRDSRILRCITESRINAVNLSYMNYDKKKNDIIFGNDTLSRVEIKRIYHVLKQNSINMRINVNVYKDNIDTTLEMNNFVDYFKGCCDAIKFSPLMKTTMFDTESRITEYTESVTFDSEKIIQLYESFENEHTIIDKKDGILGFVRYSELLAHGQKVILKYAQVEDKYNSDSEIPTLKLYPNGNLSNTWDFQKNILKEMNLFG